MEKELNELEKIGEPSGYAGELDKSLYWSELNLQLAYAVNRGIMTPKESDEWVRGMSAAESTHHAEELIRVWLPKYLSAGEEVLSTLDNLLQHQFISATERENLDTQIILSSFDSKKDKVAYLQGFIAEVEGILASFEKNISNLSLAERASLRESFFRATKAEKKTLIAKAKGMKQAPAMKSANELRGKFEVLEADKKYKVRAQLDAAFAA